MKKQKKLIHQTAMIGAFLGLGAPCGYLLYSFVLLNPSELSFTDWIPFVLHNQGILLTYLTIPTIIVFAIFGYYNGLQKQRLALKKQQMEEFLHIATHDIRSPLVVMKKGTELLRDQTTGLLSAKQARIVQMLHNQSDVMSNLVTELLDIHKMESKQYHLELIPTQLIPLIKKAIEEMTLSIEDKSGSVKLTADVPEELTVLVDSFRFRQVMRNLLSNAVRHMPEEGIIDIHIFENSPGELEITLSNDGPTIPEEKLAVIFDKFAQAQTYSQPLGIGLGLAICKNIVALHCGRIWVENIDRAGVRFHISLPKQTT